MKLRQLGSSDIFLSEIGLGAASYWGKKHFSEKQAIKVIHTALDNGVNFLDTGHSYSDGNAEIRLGKSLKNISNKNELNISTKAGTRIGNKNKLYKDFSTKWIEESCHLSLKQLGLEQLPLFQLHGPKRSDLTDELFEKLLKLKQEGKIKSIGINSFDTDVIENMLTLDIFDFVMLDYNILMQNREPLIEKLVQHDIGVIAGAALADSLYSNRVFKLKGFKDIWYLARALKSFRPQLIKGLSFRFINKIENMSASQIAIAYILNNPNITSAVFGTTSESHLLDNLQGSEITLPDELIFKLKSAYNK